MCGIAGIIRWNGRPVTEGEIRGMCRVMVHRGPDEEGLYLGEGVALGMRRLSIIDLENGQQPVSNEDRSIWVVFNGEIYNYRELRRDLERRGHTFRTSSDTETIVHLYEDLGPRCVDRLRGMFAFAVWDGRRRELLLARDRLGIKPLYYAERDGELVFASELKSILQLRDVQHSLSWEAVGHLFAFLATPSTQSIVDGVKKLEPAHVAVGRPHQPLRAERYWDVDFDPDECSSQDELVGRLRDLLVESVTLHQISDVPVGAFLSGGIDSSAVLGTMARLTPDRIKSFSIGFHEAGYDELRYARRIADQFGTEHHELIIEPDVVGIVEDLTWYLDEPFGDTSAIPTYMVSKLAAEHVKVVLTGDGGDELFAGYDKYIVEGRERQYDRLPASIRRAAGAIGAAMPHGMRGRRFLRHLALDGLHRYLDASTLFHADEMPRLFRREAFEQLSDSRPWAASLAFLRDSRDWLSAIQYRDLHTYLPLDILTKVDRMTMAHSLEARPPLLDHKLVEFAATIPPHLQLHGGTTKYLFKQAMRGILPAEIIERPKQGFAVPLARWFRGRLVGFASDVLLSDTCRQRGFVDTKYIERLLRMHQRGRDLDLQLWTTLSFELWCRRFLDVPMRGQQLQAPISTERFVRKSRRSRPRVAVVAASLDILGGQGVQARQLLNELERDGYPVTFLPVNPGFPSGLQWLRGRKYFRTLANQALYVPSLARLASADVAHVFSASYTSFLLAPAPAIAIGRVLGKRVVLHYHSGEADDHLTNWGLLVHPWLRLADEIVVPSEYLARVFANHGYRVRVIPNVVDLSRFQYRERRSLRARLLSTRNLEPYYRVDVILDAFALIKAAHPDATLTVAGYGTEEPRLRRQAAEGVSFVGRVDPGLMPRLYAEADIFLNASVVDNQPVSILEALASGLPVVSTPTGDIPAMVRHAETGLIVPPNDPRAMAEAVERLIASPDRGIAMAAQASQDVTRYTWPAVRDQWTAVYSGPHADSSPGETVRTSETPA